MTLSTKFAGELTAKKWPRVEESVPFLVSLYETKIVRPNNGIKAKNLQHLAKPLGLAARLDDDCEDLLTPLDKLGGKRGAVAHLGTVDEVIRPTDARAMVSEVLNQLHLLENLLAPPQTTGPAA